MNTYKYIILYIYICTHTFCILCAFECPWRVHTGSHLAMAMAAYKDSSSMLNQLHFGREILEGISNVICCKNNMHSTAATGKIPPFKSFIYALGV